MAPSEHSIICRVIHHRGHHPHQLTLSSFYVKLPALLLAHSAISHSPGYLMVEADSEWLPWSCFLKEMESVSSLLKCGLACDCLANRICHK